MKEKILYFASVIFGALLGAWFSGAATSNIFRNDGKIITGADRLRDTLTSGALDTFEVSTAVRLPSGGIIEISGTWAISAPVYIIPVVFLVIAYLSQVKSTKPSSPSIAMIIIAALLAFLISVSSVLVSEYWRLVNTLSSGLLKNTQTGFFDLADIFITAPTLAAGLFFWAVSGCLPVCAALNNRTQRSNKISAIWWLLTASIVAFGLLAKTATPQMA